MPAGMKALCRALRLLRLLQSLGNGVMCACPLLSPTG